MYVSITRGCFAEATWGKLMATTTGIPLLRGVESPRRGVSRVLDEGKARGFSAGGDRNQRGFQKS